MQIRKLDTMHTEDARQFIDFPFELYSDCQLWVPPLVSEMQTALNRSRCPFFCHSAGDFFVAEREGQTLGRIAVYDNRHYNEFRRTKVAFFYYFDAVDDINVARALFDAAGDWARSRGLDQIIGPKGPGAGDGIGLLVEGFEHRPAMGIAYNYPYYGSLLTEGGFEKRGDLLSGYLNRSHELPQRFYDVAEKIKAKRGFWVKTFQSKSEGRRWVPRMGRVLNGAFADTFDYYPVTDEEISAAAERLITLGDPRLIKLVMKDDKIIGFLFAFPNLSAAIQRAKGRLWPFGWIYLLREFKRTKWVDVNGLGLIPEHRGMGANAVLYTELYKTLKESQFEHADIVQAGEENLKSLAEMETLGVQWYKRHRVYQKAVVHG